MSSDEESDFTCGVDSVSPSLDLDRLERSMKRVGTEAVRTLPDGTSVTVTLGDITGDGAIDEDDLRLLQTLISETPEGQDLRQKLSPRDLAACDLDGDGVVDVRDLLILLARLLEENRELARTDDLTGLDNRRSFNDKALMKVRTARRYEVPMACLALDLDHFKLINDTHGHAAGDDALRAVADILRRSTRRSDVLCRFGGDEFLVLLDHVDLEGTRVVVDRILAFVEEARIPVPGGEAVRLGISIGVALYHPDMELVQLVHEADQSLYRAKRDGRGRADVIQVVLGVTGD